MVRYMSPDEMKNYIYTSLPTFCHGCDDFDPCIEKAFYKENGKVYTMQLTCYHCDRCIKLYEHLEKWEEEQRNGASR